MSSIFTTKIDLALKLVDTTSGRAIGESNISFQIPEVQKLTYIYKGDGTYVFMNLNKEKLPMRVNVAGYESVELNIEYEKLDPRMPMKIVFLIPSENKFERDGFLTLKGTLQGLREISLVMAGERIATSDSYNVKKNIMAVFEKGYRLNTEGSPYGLINQAGKSYDTFVVKEQLTTNSVVLGEPLKTEFIRNAAIGRVIFGSVSDTGEYLLRIRNNSSDPVAIIGIKTDEGDFFKEVNMSEAVAEGIALEAYVREQKQLRKTDEEEN